MIPSMTIYRVGKRWWLRYSGDQCFCGYQHKGRQHRIPTKTRSKDRASDFRRELELKYEAIENNQPLEDNKPVTVERAIQAFIAEKTGGQKSNVTIGKYKLTLQRLLDYCTRYNLNFLREITVEHLSQWRTEWNKVYLSTFGLRNEQSRVRAFFSYASNAQMISFNPAKALSTIKVSDEDFHIDPFTEEQVNKIIKAIPKCEDITPVNQDRVRVLMQLQRWSGLSLVDAVTLERNELKQSGKNFRIDCSRRKTGTKVQVPIPGWLGKELLRVKNGNPTYFFQSGAATPKSAVSVYDKWYRKVFEKAGIVNGGSHRFRHRFAVSALEKGADIRAVSKALGHKSLAVTERFYASWSQAQQTKMEGEIARAWK